MMQRTIRSTSRVISLQLENFSPSSLSNPPSATSATAKALQQSRSFSSTFTESELPSSSSSTASPAPPFEGEKEQHPKSDPWGSLKGKSSAELAGFQELVRLTQVAEALKTGFDGGLAACLKKEKKGSSEELQELICTSRTRPSLMTPFAEGLGAVLNLAAVGPLRSSIAEGLSNALHGSLDGGIRTLIKEEVDSKQSSSKKKGKEKHTSAMKEYLKKQRDQGVLVAGSKVHSNSRTVEEGEGRERRSSPSSSSSSSPSPSAAASVLTSPINQFNNLVVQGTEVVCRTILGAASRL